MALSLWGAIAAKSNFCAISTAPEAWRIIARGKRQMRHHKLCQISPTDEYKNATSADKQLSLSTSREKIKPWLRLNKDHKKGSSLMLKDNEQCLEYLCPLCHSAPGWQWQTLKEAVTRWHQAAWSHLYCTDIIAALVLHSADSVVSLVASGIAESSATTAFIVILVRTHVAADKTSKREKRYILLSCHTTCFASSTSPAFSSSSVSGSAFLCLQRLTTPKTKRKFHDVTTDVKRAIIVYNDVK